MACVADALPAAPTAAVSPVPGHPLPSGGESAPEDARHIQPARVDGARHASRVCIAQARGDERDGRALCAPLTEALRSYPVRIEQGKVFLQL